VVGPDDVLDGVAALVPRIEVEALFADGMRLIVLHDPVGCSQPPPALPPEPPLAWLGEALGPFTARNAGEVPIGLTSHVHLFEVNRRLELDRGAVYGLRPALTAGEKVVIEPGVSVELYGVPIGGLRVVRGHGGLVDGPLDEAGARERALALARERGYLGA
jgi:urease subunit gamma/beta